MVETRPLRGITPNHHNQSMLTIVSSRKSMNVTKPKIEEKKKISLIDFLSKSEQE
jgi:hypothetical protein